MNNRKGPDIAGRSMSMQRPTLVLSEITIWVKKKRVLERNVPYL